MQSRLIAGGVAVALLLWSASAGPAALEAQVRRPLAPYPSSGLPVSPFLEGWYDNTADNPNNPDPDAWVGGGSRTADEMAHAWIAVTHLDEEGYEKLLEEREKNKKTTEEE